MSAPSAEAAAAAFLSTAPEKAEHNQYWYSQRTIAAMLAGVDEVLSGAADGAAGATGGGAPRRVAFLSTPSLYFSMPAAARAGGVAGGGHAVLDFDDAQFGSDPGFVHYDFHKPTELPDALRGAFDLVVVDPPFITEEVWRAYAATANFLLKGGGASARAAARRRRPHHLLLTSL
jgi:hypothetical protein